MKAHTTIIYPHKATEEGALDGYLIHCVTCGPVSTCSLPTLATQWARDHEAYFSKKEGR